MARDHARVFVSIWADDDWRARTTAAQWLYGLLLTQQDLTYAGCTDLRISRWASASADMDAVSVEAALDELERHRFVVVDRNTEEVLVRSYLRVNEVWKQPKLLTLALRQTTAIQSAKLRSAMRSELVRLPADPRTEAALSVAGTLPDTPWHTPADTPPNTPADTPGGTPADTHAHTHAPGVRAHVGAPQPKTSNLELFSSRELESFGGNETLVDAREEKIPPKTIPDSTTTSANDNSEAGPDPAKRPRCAAHRHLAEDNPGPPCTDCRDARLAEVRSAAMAQSAAESADRQATRNCGYCDTEKRRLDAAPGDPPCDHQPRWASPKPDDKFAFDVLRAAAERHACEQPGCLTDGEPTPAGKPCRGPDGDVIRAPAHAVRITASRKVNA